MKLLTQYIRFKILPAAVNFKGFRGAQPLIAARVLCFSDQVDVSVSCFTFTQSGSYRPRPQISVRCSSRRIPSAQFVSHR